MSGCNLAAQTDSNTQLEDWAPLIGASLHMGPGVVGYESLVVDGIGSQNRQS